MNDYKIKPIWIISNQHVYRKSRWALRGYIVVSESCDNTIEWHVWRGFESKLEVDRKKQLWSRIESSVPL